MRIAEGSATIHSPISTEPKSIRENISCDRELGDNALPMCESLRVNNIIMMLEPLRMTNSERRLSENIVHSYNDVVENSALRMLDLVSMVVKVRPAEIRPPVAADHENLHENDACEHALGENAMRG